MSQESQMMELFLGAVKQDRKEEFLIEAKNWLVLCDSIEAKREPGLLKVEFLTFSGEFLSLAPKSYMGVCWDTSDKKDGR